MKKIPSKRQLQKMPRLHSITECRYGIIGDSDMPIGMHFFSQDYDLYMIEYDPKTRSFYGFSVDKKNPEASDFDTFSLDGLIHNRIPYIPHKIQFFWDESWTTRRMFEVENIREAFGVEIWDI